MTTSYDRFWALVDRSAGPGRCWPWAGPVTPRGAGFFEVRRRRTTARRYAYRCEYGDPGRLRVVVTCGTAACCNPAHLTVASARAVALGNGSAAAVLAAAVACATGHPLTAGNVYRRPGAAHGECLACKRARRASS